MLGRIDETRESEVEGLDLERVEGELELACPASSILPVTYRSADFFGVRVV